MQMFDEPDQPTPRAPKRAKAEQSVLKSPPTQQNVSFIQVAELLLTELPLLSMTVVRCTFLCA